MIGGEMLVGAWCAGVATIVIACALWARFGFRIRRTIPAA
jgi:hypothetical protein